MTAPYTRSNLPEGYLSVRARNVLKSLGVRSTEGLALLSASTLQSTRNCGEKTFQEIATWADTHGLAIGDGFKTAENLLKAIATQESSWGE